MLVQLLAVRHFYNRLFVYIILNIVFAVFATVLGAWKAKVPQPATWSSIQTRPDFVDKGYMVDCVRHAGTVSKREALGEIDVRALYA